MIVTASQKFIRVSPQKVKFVADAVKAMSLVDMRTHLSYLNKEAARKLLSTLNQGLANAQHNYGLKPEQLKLESLLILRGPQYKRMRARSRGQGHPILKRTTHIMLKLRSLENEVKKEVIKSEVKNVEPKSENKVEKKTTKKIVKKTTVKKVTKKVVEEKQ